MDALGLECRFEDVGKHISSRRRARDKQTQQQSAASLADVTFDHIKTVEPA
jgi:hypothetical protein